eukprot:COSAG05_NODE_325_length_11376_cov_31.743726_2_plen_391_part_00
MHSDLACAASLAPVLKSELRQTARRMEGMRMDGIAIGPYRKTHVPLFEPSSILLRQETIPSMLTLTGAPGLDASQKIGDGAGCVGVYQAIDTRSGRVVAIKTVDRSKETDPAWKHSFQRELDIAIKLQHPNVIGLVDVVFWERYVCLVMEHAGGGELFQLVANTGAMPEDMARIYFLQILSAAAYCHSRGVCHRDLKLENCLLSTPGSQLVKITDFGLSKDIEQHSQPRTQRVGTVSYMAPEVSMASGLVPYDGAAADVWSLGVILYVLVCCDYPFGFDGSGGVPTQHVLAKVSKGVFQFPTGKMPLSSEFMSLVSGMLTLDVNERLTMDRVAAHPWSTAGQYLPDATAIGEARREIDWASAPSVSDVQLATLGSVESNEEFCFDEGVID